MDVVGQAVEQGAGEALTAEDLGPLVERQVAGDQDRTAFVALGEDLEEEFGTGLGQRHEAEFGATDMIATTLEAASTDDLVQGLPALR